MDVALDNALIRRRPAKYYTSLRGGVGFWSRGHDDEETNWL
jgi:hypothetical protein